MSLFWLNWRKPFSSILSSKTRTGLTQAAWIEVCSPVHPVSLHQHILCRDLMLLLLLPAEESTKPRPQHGRCLLRATLPMHTLAKYELQLFKRVRFIFLLQFPPPGSPPPTSVQLKPDLIPLHMGNLLVYWAFLDGKLHCLSSWAEALEQFAAFLQLFSQG